MFAKGARFLMWIVVPLGVTVCGCNSLREDAQLAVPETASSKVARILRDMESYVSQSHAAKENDHLRRLSDLCSGIVQCCDKLMGQNATPAPSASEWGGISEQQYEDILKKIGQVRESAKWCRDYAKDMQYHHLEGAWRAFVAQYGELQALIDDLGS